MQTLRHTSDQLDQIYKQYEQLLEADRDYHSRVERAKDAQHNLMIREAKEKAIRQTTENKRNLKQQIKTRTLREKKTRDKMVAEEEAANNLIRNDDTLMAIYPKIKAVPEYLRKQNETKANKKLTEANKMMLDAKNSEMLA